jgi:putative oxidoreductase
MALHGGQKLYGWYGGPGLEGTTGWLGSMGFRPARFHATLTGIAESVGGIFLAIGLFTPFAAAAIIGVMLVAIATVHWANGFFNTAGGYEFNLLIVATSAALAFTGAGRISFDHALGMDMRGIVWGLAALALACTAAALTLFSRQQSVATTDEVIATDEAIVLDDPEAAEDTEVIVLSEESSRLEV